MSNQSTSTSEIVVKKRDNNTFDVFYGHGWDNWAHFRRDKGRLLLVKGLPVPNAVYSELSKQVFGR